MTVYLKALFGAAAAGLGSLYQALDNEVITQQEWVAVAIATLGAAGVIWGVPNQTPEPAALVGDEPPEDGW